MSEIIVQKVGILTVHLHLDIWPMLLFRVTCKSALKFPSLDTQWGTGLLTKYQPNTVVKVLFFL